MADTRDRGELFYITVQTDGAERMAQLLAEHPLDYGCRANPLRRGDGGLMIRALATQEQIEGLRRADFHLEVGENATELARQRMQEVGRGDRFEGGRVAPRGRGQKLPE
jgi:hypothetical protein